MNKRLATLWSLTFMAFLILFAVGSSCKTITPPEGPGTEYPCGVWGVECRNHTCCPYKHECGDSQGKGYFNTCPDGYCCYIGGDDWPGVSLAPEGGLPDGGLPKHMSIVKAKPKPEKH